MGRGSNSPVEERFLCLLENFGLSWKEGSRGESAGRRGNGKEPCGPKRSNLGLDPGGILFFLLWLGLGGVAFSSSLDK